MKWLQSEITVRKRRIYLCKMERPVVVVWGIHEHLSCALHLHTLLQSLPHVSAPPDLGVLTSFRTKKEFPENSTNLIFSDAVETPEMNTGR